MSRQVAQVQAGVDPYRAYQQEEKAARQIHRAFAQGVKWPV
ncbi:hypothetical protein QW180_01765 [Vibrio sinaloensis]|nr:hypothetical protein [Vibrio sinaloensis]